MSITGIPTTAGADTVTVTPSGRHSVDAGAGVDTLVVRYGALTTSVETRGIGYGWSTITDDFASRVDFYGFERFRIATGSGDDYLEGRELADRLTAGAGADTLAGGLGADTIDGGAGLDRWIANYGASNSDISVTLDATRAVTVGGVGARLTGVEEAELTTGAGDDLLDARAVSGAQRFTSGAGDDVFKVRSGPAVFNGGDGVDLLVADFSAATTRIGLTNLGYGWGRLADLAGTRSVEAYGVERVDYTGGAADDTLIGGALADRLAGGGGNDLLNGVEGADTIDGGAGVDTWEADYSTRVDPIRVALGARTSTANVATLAGVEAMRLTTGAGDDRLTAQSGRYDDRLRTGEGDDVVSTGRGVDEANGGDGTDTLIMKWTALARATDDIVHSDQGYGWRRFAAPTGDILDFYGFEKFNLAGGAGRDQLIGGADRDTLSGGGGDDLLDSGGGRATISGGAGLDLWRADLTAINLGMSLSAKASQTAAQLTARGFSVRGVERLDLRLGAGADNVSTAGYAGDDRVDAGAGDDRIALGLGRDRANGEAGTDILVLDYGSQSVDIERTGQGYGWWRYGGHDGRNYIDYYAFERFDLTGGAGCDALSGGDGADTLRGGAGDDTLAGGAGGADVIDGGAGVDDWSMDLGRATKSLRLTLDAAGNGALSGAGVTLRGIENVALTTGAGNDVIDLGRSVGEHRIVTGDGDDRINLGRSMHNEVNGGGGTDSLTIDASRAVAGLRTVYDGYGWWSFRTGSGDYRTQFYAIEKFAVTGSAFNDRLTGQGGDDTLRGGGGNDILRGEAGNDRLFGGAGADMFEFASLGDHGVDRVGDAAAGDVLRFFGARIDALAAGDGADLASGRAELVVSGGVTTIFVGLDADPEADFSVDLAGVFGVASFRLDGYSDITGASELIVL